MIFNQISGNGVVRYYGLMSGRYASTSINIPVTSGQDFDLMCTGVISGVSDGIFAVSSYGGVCYTTYAYNGNTYCIDDNDFYITFGNEKITINGLPSGVSFLNAYYSYTVFNVERE